MINNVNLNNAAVAAASGSALATAKTNGADDVKVNAQVNTGASAVVDLQSNVEKTENKSSVKVDASNAKSMVADIAALLGRSNGNFQANLNGFDAARLLG